MLENLQREAKRLATPKRAKSNEWFFKTGKGDYGEGDVFLGLTVPDCRKVAHDFKDLSLVDSIKLLNSKYHEERLIALFILVAKFEKGDGELKDNIYKLYLKNSNQVNNWDLVDSSAHKIVGAFLKDRNRCVLYKLAKSQDLWEKRIAIIATARFIQSNDFVDTLKVAKILLSDSHDLIHKAVGWMLREVGKKNMEAEEKFLKKHYKKMPRTMLRYAIEKFPEVKRQSYLLGKV